MAKKKQPGLRKKELLENTPVEILDRASDQISVSLRQKILKGRVGSNAAVQMKTKTAESGNKHIQEIRLLDNNRYYVSCDCENFMFVWEYALTQKGASSIEFGNGEPPVETNPGLVCGVCKHIAKLLMNERVEKRLNKEMQKNAA